MTLSSWFMKDLDLTQNFEHLLCNTMNENFSQQTKSLWLYGIIATSWEIWRSRNSYLFESKKPNFLSSKAWILASMRESSALISGFMHNCQYDLIILHNLGIEGNTSRGPSITPVSWNLPPPGWIKVNIDDSAKGASGRSGYGGVFRTSRGFVKRCFSVFLGINYAFEAVIFGFMIAIEIACKFG